MGKKQSLKNVSGVANDIRADDHVANQDLQPSGSSKGGSAAGEKQSKLSRERKSLRIETLRRKNVGFSVDHINVEPSASKRIKFDDEESFHDDSELVPKVEAVNNDDDDDAIEEVKASDAKDQVLQQLAQEEAIAQEEMALANKKKKKRSKMDNVKASNSDDDQSLDDALLQLVDSEKQLQRDKAAVLQISQKRNTHITFKLGVDEDVGTLNAGPNIQLVVLPFSENMMGSTHSELLGIAPSKTALQLCRNRLTAEKTIAKMDEIKGGKKAQKKTTTVDCPIVERSRKAKYYRRCGRSAANFKVLTK